jgi:oligosaccharide 4-alpha-D-glucosyltransferase
MEMFLRITGVRVVSGKLSVMIRFALLLSFFACTNLAIAQSGFGSFQQLKQETGTVIISTSEGKLFFRNYPGNIVQTTFEAATYKGEQISNAVLLKPITTGLRIKLQNREKVILTNSVIEIEILKQPVTISYRYIKTGDEFYLSNITTKDQHRVLQFNLIDENEQFFGTGSRSIPFNKRGYKVGLDNNPWYGYNTDADNLNYSMPFYISNYNYGVFYDNPSRGYIDFGKLSKDTLEVAFKAGKLQFYTFFGENASNIIQQFTSLVGRMSLPPRWALGNFMSRFGYRTQEEVMSIAAKMKEQKFPFDAVIIDLFWFGDAVHGAWNLGNLDWNKQRFPEPEKMIADLKKQNIKTILITEPFVLAESFNYKHTQQNKLNTVDAKGDTVGIKEFYFGHTGLLDLFQNKTKDWFWSKYDAQIKKGVAGWWGDLGEPEKHPNYVYHNLKDFGQTRLFNADEVHNMYGHEWSKMVFDKYTKHYPAQRLFHLNRSGYAGTWRFGSVPWSGDVDRSWKGFNAQLPIMLSMSMSGVPAMHSDAGGFAMGERDPELYRRWFQMAVFSPIFRPHGSVNAPDPKIAQIESEPVFYDEPDKSILRSFVELRYRLMPYIYTLVYEAATKGHPMVRPMFYNNNTDSNLYKANDQYMFGDALLIAPVLEKGASKRKLYLPQGTWYDFYNPAKTFTGGKWVEVDLNAETIPVFVKGGSVIPMKPTFDNTAFYPKEKLIFHYYAAEGFTTTEMYEDDGVNPKAIAAKQFERIQLYSMKKENTVTVSISSKGLYVGKPAQRNIDLFVYGITKPKEVFVNKQLRSEWNILDNGGVHLTNVSWNGATLTITAQ